MDEEEKRLKISLSEFENAMNSAHYYDQIGWLITSFFLIFVGTLIGGILTMNESSIYNSKILLTSIIICAIGFGLIVMNLFFHTQDKKEENYRLCKDIYEDQKNKFKTIYYEKCLKEPIKNNNLNQFFYFVFILLIEIVLSGIILIRILS